MGMGTGPALPSRHWPQTTRRDSQGKRNLRMTKASPATSLTGDILIAQVLIISSQHKDGKNFQILDKYSTVGRELD